MILYTIQQMRRLKFREVKSFTQGHTARIQAHYPELAFSTKKGGKKNAALMTGFRVREISK